MSELVCLSVAHDTAPVAWRERLAVPARAQGAVAAGHVRAGAAGEALVLATCGRLDTYAIATDGDRAELALLERLARRAGMEDSELVSGARALRGTAAARHLLRTAAGLASPVLGESEILGQLRRAHDGARGAGASGPVLDRLVVHALRVGRRARAETPLGAGAVSLSSVGTGLARTLFGDAAGRGALVVGATWSKRRAIARLVADGWAVTSLLDRSDGPSLAPLLGEFDLLVTCTGKWSRLLPVEALIDAAGGRGEHPLLVLDLSVPRDVDPAAREVEGLLLYDVDDLAAAAEHALAARRAGVPRAEALVEEELGEFEGWCATRLLVPTLKALREHVRRAVRDGLGDALSQASDDDGALERALERAVTHVLHTPTRRLRAAAALGDGDRYAGLLRDLFGLRDDTSAVGPPPSVSGSPVQDAGTGSVIL
jgi:glutamyl-tRNA reductase